MASLYRGLIGRWDVEVIDFENDGTRRTSQGEWHFGWALEGRAVQEGMDSDGTLIRWSFVEITRDRLHWLGEKSTDTGHTWKTRAEIFGRRVSFAQLR